MYSMQSRNKIVFHINQQRHEISDARVFQTLAEYLRYDLGLTGTKVVCAEGDCGACTTLLGSIHEVQDGKLRYKAVNSCILPLASLDGCHIITVEGLKKGAELHPVQKSMAENFAAQCGYCTPGFVCAMTALVEESLAQKKSCITEKSARNYLTGNLCRCTGYEPILNAAQALELSQIESLSNREHSDERLLEFRSLVGQSVHIKGEGFVFFSPTTVAAASELKSQFPDLKIIAGSTDLGVVVNKGRDQYKKVMSLQHIQELRQVNRRGDSLEVGARVTLTSLQKFVEQAVPEFGNILHVFASPQIKNQATLVGNLVNGSPIGDTLPFLVMNEARLVVHGSQGKREIVLEKFYLGYKKLDLRADEFVTAVIIPIAVQKNLMRLYKVARRKDLDISAVTFAGHIEIEGRIIKKARVVFGGVGPTVARIKELENAWIGSEFNRELFERSGQKLDQLIKPLSDVRGTSDFRMQLCRNLLLKFHDEIAAERNI